MKSFYTLYTTDPARAIRLLDWFLRKERTGVTYHYQDDTVVSSISGCLYSYRFSRHFSTFQEWKNAIHCKKEENSNFFFTNVYVGRNSLVSILKNITEETISAFRDVKYRAMLFYRHLCKILRKQLIPMKERDTIQIEWNDQTFMVDVNSIQSTTAGACLDILQTFEAGIPMEIWYISNEIPQKLNTEEDEKTVLEPIMLPTPYTNPYSSPSIRPVSYMPPPPLPQSFYQERPSADHMLFQSNLLSKTIQDMSALHQHCQKLQQKVEELEARLASMDSLEKRIAALESLDTENRLSYVEGFEERITSLENPPPAPYANLIPVQNITIPPMHLMQQSMAPMQPMQPMVPMQQPMTPMQPMDPVLSLFHAIQMAQMVQAASQQSAENTSN